MFDPNSFAKPKMILDLLKEFKDSMDDANKNVTEILVEDMSKTTIDEKNSINNDPIYVKEQIEKIKKAL